MAVEPSTTYTIRCFAKGNKLGKCYVGATFDTGGKQRQTLPIGTYDWQEIISQVTTPADCKKMSIHFATDGICDDLWIDDVSLSRAPMQFANLAEPRYEKTFSGMFPATPARCPRISLWPMPRHPRPTVCCWSPCRESSIAGVRGCI